MEMTNKERIDALKEAEALIRSVEFSYPVGSEIRQGLYRAVVISFGMGSTFNRILNDLKDAYLKEQYDQEPLEDDCE